MKTSIISLNVLINDYLQFCLARKNLDKKTIKSNTIDLRQYNKFIYESSYDWFSKKSIVFYVEHIHAIYKPKSIKRKIASLKAFFHFIETEELLEINPFHKIQFKYKEPFVLPKTIPITTIEQIINFAYIECRNITTLYIKKIALRNVLILELIFTTRMRISELCSLTPVQLDLNEYIIKIHGRGSMERLIQIRNKSIQMLIDEYIKTFGIEICSSSFIFTNRLHNKLSEQSVRNMINMYAQKCEIPIHITPHMFRHSFATLLLEEDVDIRYIHQMLGHS